MFNVILITIDCLRADHLPFLGYERYTTPFIDSLARQGLLFTETIINGIGTFASLTAIMTGAHPLINGEYGRIDKLTIAEILKSYGYITVGFVVNNAFLSQHFGFDRGFVYFNWFKSPKAKHPVLSILNDTGSILSKVNKLIGNTVSYLAHSYSVDVYGMDGAFLNKAVISWLKQNHNKRFFLWVHYMDAHGPHYVPESYLREFSKKSISKVDVALLNAKLVVGRKLNAKELEFLKLIYDAELRYIDDRVKELFSIIQRLGLESKTYIIITGDHGEEFFDHGNYHSHTQFYEEMIRVPLIIYGPDVPIKIVREQVQHVDIAPTIIDLLQLEARSPWFTGKNLLCNNPTSEFIITEVSTDYDKYLASHGIIKGTLASAKYSIRYSKDNIKVKLIYDVKTCKKELYDLKKDPKERINIFLHENLKSRYEDKIYLLRSILLKHIRTELRLWKLKRKAVRIRQVVRVRSKH